MITNGMLYCGVGGEPITSTFYRHDGTPVCERHYFELFGKRCVIGGEILRGQYLINEWGEPYCADHAVGLAKCYSCYRHICQRRGGGHLYGDGRSVCHQCRGAAISYAWQGRSPLKEVCRVLTHAGLPSVGTGDWINISLHSQQELSQMGTESYARNPAGRAIFQRVYEGNRVSATYTVALLYGLPWEHFAHVAAHEVGHLYMFGNDFPSLSTQVSEGLCEVFSYVWLQSRKTPEAELQIKRMWETSNPVYGVGFRAAISSFGPLTLRQLMDYVKRHACLPTAPARAW